VPSLLRASLAAIRRARVAILTIAATYLFSLAVGIAMVSTGNVFALERRDEIVGGAQSSEILVADRRGDHLRAAGLDFASNLVLGGITSTVTGITVVGSYPSSRTAAGSEASYRWTRVTRAGSVT